MNTVYDRIQTMTKDELQNFLYHIYLWGHLNEQCNTKDEHFYQTLLDQPIGYADAIVVNFDNLTPVRIKVIPLDDTMSPHELGIKFISHYNAYCYLREQLPNIITVDETTYATPNIIYKLIPCDDKLS